MTVAVVIPFRDRGHDPLRLGNLHRVLARWAGFEVIVASDGRAGDAQFNRSAAYNHGAGHTTADVLVYAEADMLIDHHQIHQAIHLAIEEPGLVVPFTEYRYLTPEDSERVRNHQIHPKTCAPEWVMGNRQSIGAINVLSRRTLQLVGQWDEHFDGNGWDDRAMKHAFHITTQPTRFIDGPAYHLHHLPGWTGQHLTQEDKQATLRNRNRYQLYKQAHTPERIRELTQGAT